MAKKCFEREKHWRRQRRLLGVVPKQSRLMLGAKSPVVQQTAGAGGTSDLVTTPSATGGRTHYYSCRMGSRSQAWYRATWDGSIGSLSSLAHADAGLFFQVSAPMRR